MSLTFQFHVDFWNKYISTMVEDYEIQVVWQSNHPIVIRMRMNREEDARHSYGCPRTQNQPHNQLHHHIERRSRKVNLCNLQLTLILSG